MAGLHASSIAGRQERIDDARTDRGAADAEPGQASTDASAAPESSKGLPGYSGITVRHRPPDVFTIAGGQFMRSRSEMVIGALLATALLAVTSIFFRPSNETIAFWKELAGPISTLGAAIAASWVAYRLGRGQIAVAQAQADIARRTWETTNEKIVLDLLNAG
jgi:hypothetical protein